MKLFQQLLVAPAALGLLAPVAQAADLNISGISDYAAEEQVTSITQFSDVYPTDWAYQALSNLVEMYGCVAGYPNGTFRGNRAMTRYEAAALLNACLDRVTEVTDELRRLMSEFESELAVLRGRVDGLEARVGELEATQFSTTTKLSGYTAWIMGAANGFDDDVNEAVSVNYDLRLTLETSFTGEDMLTTRLRSGNFGPSIWDEGLTFIETASSTGNSVVVDRLFYTFPVGDSLTVTAGPIVRMDDAGMLGGYATAYPSDLLLDFFTYAGGTTTQNLAGAGAGVGAVWEFAPGFTLSGNYVAYSGGNDSSVGIGTDETGSVSAWQLMYTGEQLGGGVTAAVAYSYERNFGLTIGTSAANELPSEERHNWSIAGSWAPLDSGPIPSISAGYGYADPSDTSEEVQTWYVGVEWSDVFFEGNSFGGAIGQAPYVIDDGDDEENYMWEAFYKIAVSDNITVTPAIFGISPYTTGGDDDIFGGFVKTTFVF